MAAKYETVLIYAGEFSSSGRKPDVKPRCAELKTGGNKEVLWVTVPPGLNFTVKFDKEKGSPFEETVLSGVGIIKSGPIKVNPKGKDEFYAYTLEVDNHEIIDPGIIIWD